MASAEWYDDVRPALVRMQKVGGHAARGAAGGAAAVLLMGLVGLGWNMSTDGGLVRLLGVSRRSSWRTRSRHTRVEQDLPVRKGRRDHKGRRAQPVLPAMPRFRHPRRHPCRS